MAFVMIVIVFFTLIVLSDLAGWHEAPRRQRLDFLGHVGGSGSCASVTMPTSLADGPSGMSSVSPA
jgi:hypothetical protein